MAKSSGPAVIIIVAGLVVMGMTMGMVFFLGAGGSDSVSAPAPAPPARATAEVLPPPAIAPPPPEPSDGGPLIIEAPAPSDSAKSGPVTLESNVRPAANGDPPPEPTDDAEPESRGDLAPAVVRRVVRQHAGRVRSCYQTGLTKNPNLAGRVDVKFVIDETGKVSSAVMASSSLGDDDVEACVSKVIRSMRFPKPEGGGSVTVKYPFNFEPG